MRILRGVFVMAIIIGLSSFVYKTFFAASCDAINSGNWSDQNIWSGCTGTLGLPGALDDISIPEGYSVNIDSNSISINSLTINGELTVEPSSSYDFTSGEIDIGTSGVFDATSSNIHIILNGINNGPLFYIGTGGVFNSESSRIDVTSKANVTFSSGGGVFNDVSFLPDIDTEYTYILNTEPITINGNFTINPSSGGGSLSLNVIMQSNVDLDNNGITTIMGNSNGLSILDTNGYELTSGTIVIDAGGTLTAHSSTITLTSYDGSNRSLYINGGIFNYDTSTVVFAINNTNSNSIVPYYDFTGNPIDFYNLTFYQEVFDFGHAYTDTVFNLSSNDLNVHNNFYINSYNNADPGGGGGYFTVYAGSDITVEGTTTITNSLGDGYVFLDDGYSNLTFNINDLVLDSAGFYPYNSTVNLSGDATLSNSSSINSGLPGFYTGYLYIMGSSQQTFSGDFSSSAFDYVTITNNSGTNPDTSPSVILDSSMSLSNDLRIETPSTKVRFHAGSTYTIGGSFYCDGQADGTNVELRSSTEGSRWNLAITTPTPVFNCNPEDSDATLSTTSINATDASNYNYGNNVNWLISSAPVEPRIFTATAQDGSILLNWIAPISNGGQAITDYIVQYKLNSSGTWITYNDGVGTDLSTTISPLTNGLLYNFRVRAVNSVGEGLNSIVSGTPGLVPGIPTNLSGIGNGTTISLDWDAPIYNGGIEITDYVVQYMLTESRDSWTTFNDGSSNATSAIVTGLINGSTYDFRVFAVNSAGQSDSSSVLTIFLDTEIQQEDSNSNGGVVLPGSLDKVDLKKISLKINNGYPSTKDRIIPISVKTGSDILTMAISTDSDFKNTGIKDLKNNFMYDLCQPDDSCKEGLYTVYIKFYTRWGVSSPVFVNKVILNLDDNLYFKKNLRFFDIDTEVQKLQKFLNSQGFKLSDSGYGSEGNETNFFGNRTKKALIKFQEKYSKDILEPINLKNGTGFFGDFTRKLINTKFFGQ